MPPDLPIIAVQAPELVRNTSITSTLERVFFYRDLLVSELAHYNPCILIIGYSLGGYLAYELVQSLENTKLFCGALCLVDPAPFCPSSLPRQ